MRVVLAVLLALAAPTATVVARTWHVAPDGTGDAPTIQAGIDSAVAGDTVSLSNGVFRGVWNRAVDFRGKAILVCSESGTPDSCVIDCEKDDRAFLFITGEGHGSVLRMVKIINGLKRHLNGGAVYCESSPVVVGCVFSGNSSGQVSGGAVYCEGSPRFVDCEFRNNEAVLNGGAVYCKGAGGSAPEFVDCSFVGNRAKSRGGAVYLSSSVGTFAGCRFTGNVSTDRGGAIASENWSYPTIADCVFEENSGLHGGGIASYGDGGGTISSCSFRRNIAAGAGGAVILNDSSTAHILSCLFADNQGENGGAIAFFNHTNPIFENCTIVSSRGTVSGGCVYVGGLGGASPVLENSILAFSDEGAAVSCGSGSITLVCCDVYGNAGGDWVGCLAGQEDSLGNLSTDPLFCFPDTGNFRLHANSPCLNAPGCGLVGAFPAGCAFTGVAGTENIPRSCGLSANTPNPFNPSTSIRFTVPERAEIDVIVYDSSGRRVAGLASGVYEPGEHAVVWDGRDDAGREVPSGAYFMRLRAGEYRAVRKVLLIR